MSTLRNIALSTITLLCIMASAGATLLQGGTEPIAFTGPKSVSSGGTYTYTVTVQAASAARNAASAYDTVLTISNSNSSNWVNFPSTITIPAGQTSASFNATVSEYATESVDELMASNNNGAVTIDVLVEE